MSLTAECSAVKPTVMPIGIYNHEATISEEAHLLQVDRWQGFELDLPIESLMHQRHKQVR